MLQPDENDYEGQTLRNQQPSRCTNLASLFAENSDYIIYAGLVQRPLPKGGHRCRVRTNPYKGLMAPVIGGPGYMYLD